MSFTKKTTGLCRRCEGETKLIVRGGRSVSLSALLEEPDSDGSRPREFQTDLPYELVECCSCEYIDLRSSKDLSGASGFTVRFHPQLSTRSVPSWRRELPREFSPLLDEVYIALNTESRVLAMMGVRAVLDIILDQKVGDIATFKGRLMALEELRLVGSRDREFIWNALVEDAGLAAFRAPTLDTLNRVMDVLEEILHAVYVQRDETLQPARVGGDKPAAERLAPPAIDRRDNADR